MLGLKFEYAPIGKHVCFFFNLHHGCNQGSMIVLQTFEIKHMGTESDHENTSCSAQFFSVCLDF